MFECAETLYKQPCVRGGDAFLQEFCLQKLQQKRNPYRPGQARFSITRKRSVDWFIVFFSGVCDVFGNFDTTEKKLYFCTEKESKTEK